ncbi:MAG: hypothetical protein IJ262_06280 [Clostridia bacterium]|nr:hypothetical protein [Clostridia bacterium]
MKFSSLFSSETYKKFYNSVTSDEDLFETLKAMPAEYEMEVEDAEALAKEFMDTTASYEYIRDCALDENAMAAIEDCVGTLSRNTPFTKTEILHRMNCGLGLTADREKLESLNESSLKEIFENYVKTESKKDTSEEELMKSIFEKLSHSPLSSNHLRDYAKRLNETGDPLYSSVALGKNGYKFRCVAAMDLYLKSENLSVEEAVCRAATQVDIQAVASAVRHGEVCQKYADRLVDIFKFVADFTVFIVVCSSLLLLFPGIPVVIPYIIGLISGFAFDYLVTVNTKAIGAYFAKNRYLSYNREVVIEGLEVIADSIDEEAEEVEEVASATVTEENLVVLSNPLNS